MIAPQVFFQTMKELVFSFAVIAVFTFAFVNFLTVMFLPVMLLLPEVLAVVFLHLAEASLLCRTDAVAALLKMFACVLNVLTLPEKLSGFLRCYLSASHTFSETLS